MPKAESLKNWKVRGETLRQVNRLCLDLDVTQADLAVMALVALRADPVVRAGRVKALVSHWMESSEPEPAPRPADPPDSR